MWEAIERLQQGKSLNIQDVKTNLFWEFRKFTSHDGETMEGYYARFYKLMNEMIRNNLTVATMQVNVQFLQQLQLEWSRNANPLALVATAQPNQDPYYQTPKPYKPYVLTSKASIPTRSHATTRNKVKEIAKPIAPPSESASKEDNDPEQAQRDKDMQKNLDLIAKYFKKIYKPTNNNLRTSSNSRNNNVDSTPIKPKRVKDSAYHKEKMLMYKQAEKVIPLQAEQSDWLVDMDEEIDEQELEAHYSNMAKIQEVPSADSGTNSEPLEQVQYNDEYNVFANVNQHCEQSESISNTCLVEKDDSDVTPDSPDMCEHDIQTDQNTEDEPTALANLIANLKFNVDENKKIQKLSHLNFDYINLLSKKDVVIGLPNLKYVKDQLCSSCEVSKAKRSSFKTKTVPSSKGRLNLLYMDLCGPMRVAIINGKKYILMPETFVANDTLGLVPQRQKASDYDNSDPVPQIQNVLSLVDTTIPSQQVLDLLFGPLYDEFINAEHEFTNPFSTPIQEVAESSSHNIGTSNVHAFNQPQVSEYRWTKDYPLEQVCGNPSRPVQTRRQLETNPKMCMFAITVSTVEPKNIKEVMANSAWINAMQE
nr:ribonuclease H-like domain-containing protein [Tanacetum cinerariifolium]